MPAYARARLSHEILLKISTVLLLTGKRCHDIGPRLHNGTMVSFGLRQPQQTTQDCRNYIPMTSLLHNLDWVSWDSIGTTWTTSLSSLVTPNVVALAPSISTCNSWCPGSSCTVSPPPSLDETPRSSSRLKLDHLALMDKERQEDKRGQSYCVWSRHGIQPQWRQGAFWAPCREVWIAYFINNLHRCLLQKTISDAKFSNTLRLWTPDFQVLTSRFSCISNLTWKTLYKVPKLSAPSNDKFSEILVIN